jgi:superfamily II DNA or RNA helicase
MRGLHALAASIAGVDVPAGLERADVDILPYQLEPAVALRRGEAVRLLIADHVGLGKTIQAGIVIADLVARQEAPRVLIVTPAGLRHQWEEELRRRFGLQPVVCSARWLSGEVGRWPAGVNPWTPPAIRVVSVDFLKRAEVLNALDGLTWDLLVVDEAHGASAGSDRGAAVGAVARRSLRVVCTTATPHDGVEAGFDALCGLGRHGAHDRIALFRRSRRVLGHDLGRRRVALRVAVSAAERRVHDLLAGYRRAADTSGWPDPGARLALTVLVKRALSSARALELTAARRRALLDQGTSIEQVALPFAEPLSDQGDGDVPDHVLARPALPNARRERAWLGALVEAARRAARAETKVAALARLLRRAREPHLVFTEYRDTLGVLARAVPAEHTAVLHGGQSPDERRQALSAFASGRVRILLATDTASEGLNLHARCRSVVLFDVPWTPTRAEQRIGRVDRIGQSRRVHALSLVAADTPDELLVARQGERASIIHDALGPSVAVRTSEETPRPGRVWPRLHADAARAADVIAFVRAMSASRGARACPHLPSERRAKRAGAPLITTLFLRRPLCGLPQGLLVVVRVDIGPPPASALETLVVPLVCELGGAMTLRGPGLARMPARHIRNAVASLLSRHDVQIRDATSAAVGPRPAEAEQIARRRDELLAERAAAVSREHARSLARALVQPGLFDALRGTAPTARGAATVHHPTSVECSGASDVGVPGRMHVALAALFYMHPRAGAHRHP